MPTIEDILDEFGIPKAGIGHRHGRAGWVQIDCPWCGRGDGKYHLGISTTTLRASCWRCGSKRVAEAVALASGKPIGCVAAALKGARGVRFAAHEPRVVGRFRAPSGVGGLLAGHEAYLRGRGYDPPKIAALWGVCGIGNAPSLRWRLYIPVIHHGIPVSWTTRACNPHDPMRYVSAPATDEAVPHKRLLYGADYARHAIIIHEGPLDVWATGPGAVATFGVVATAAQILAMSRYNVRVVCFDNDAPGRDRARELSKALSAFPGTTHNVTLDSAKDAGGASPGEIQELRRAFLD